jgi:cytochrome P450
MSQPTLEYPEIDFAMDEVPELHDVLRDLRERHAVAPVQYHGGIAYLITRFDDLQKAMSDDVTFPSAAAYSRHSLPSMGKTLQCMEGQEHRRNRALVSKAFRPRLMTEFVEAFLTPVAHDLIDSFAARGEADLVADYTTRYAFTVITRLLDFPPTDFEQLKAWGDGLIDFPWDPDGAIKAREEFTAYMKPIIDERRTKPGEDLISSLATVEVDGEGLSDEEIYSFLRLLFPAGADTTYRGLGSMFYAVLTHREVFEAVQKDPDFVPSVGHPLRGRRHSGGLRGALRHHVREPRREHVQRAGSLRPLAQRARVPDLRTRPALLPGLAPRPARDGGELARCGRATARPGAVRPLGRGHCGDGAAGAETAPGSLQGWMKRAAKRASASSLASRLS